ncbi:MAG: cytidine deaminase [Chitinophagales bacterium]|nr:cytidine deaminase [Chitinophagales bacterium]
MEKKTIKIDYFLAKNTGELNMSERALLQAAMRATKNSHAPYSKFHVGAALLLDDGSVIEGSNQENASFPIGLCAERTALSAKASIAPQKKVKMIAIRTKSNLSQTTEPAAPCGICRQALLEVEETQKHNIKVILQGEFGSVLVFNSVKELLPFYFGSKDF